MKAHPLRRHTVNEVRLGPCSVPEASNHGKACVRVNKLSQSVHRVKVGNYHLEVDRGESSFERMPGGCLEEC